MNGLRPSYISLTIIVDGDSPSFLIHDISPHPLGEKWKKMTKYWKPTYMVHVLFVRFFFRVIYFYCSHGKMYILSSTTITCQFKVSDVLEIRIRWKMKRMEVIRVRGRNKINTCYPSWSLYICCLFFIGRFRVLYISVCSFVIEY